MSTTAKLTKPRQRVNRLELERFFAGLDVSMARGDRLSGRYLQSSNIRVPEVEKFFSIIRHRIEPRERLLNRKKATQFNVFDFIEPDENKLSDILAWLLNPQESHGQGDLFLRLLFMQVGLDMNAKLATMTTVQREAPTFGIKKYRRRIDVLVEAGSRLAIENKVNSMEQSEQVKDYLEHLRRSAGNRKIKSALIYLTPAGRPPESLTLAARKRHEANGLLHCWSYQSELVEWIEECHRKCEAKRINFFLQDLLSYIKSKLNFEMENRLEKEENEN